MTACTTFVYLFTVIVGVQIASRNTSLRCSPSFVVARDVADPCDCFLFQDFKYLLFLS